MTIQAWLGTAVAIVPRGHGRMRHANRDTPHPHM